MKASMSSWLSRAMNDVEESDEDYEARVTGANAVPMQLICDRIAGVC